jgi:hypothetical protein
VLSVFSSGKRNGEDGSQEMRQAEAEAQRDQSSGEGAEEEEAAEEEGEQAMSAMGEEREEEEEEEDDWDLEDEIEELREAFSYVIVDREGNIDRRQGILLGKPGVKVLEVFAQEAPSVPEDWVTIKIGEPAYAAIEAVGAGRRGSLAYDTALSILIDAYGVLYGSGVVGAGETSGRSGGLCIAGRGAGTGSGQASAGSDEGKRGGACRSLCLCPAGHCCL